MSAIAAMHVAKKQLGLDDETYRAVLQRVTGKTSARDMNDAERGRVLEEFRNRGFKPASTGARKRLEGRYAKKLQALWIAGWNLGVVRDRTDEALVHFVQRQTGVDHVRFLHHPEDANKAIEAIKGWLARTGGVDWTLGRHMSAMQRMPGYKVALAQWNILVAKVDMRGTTFKAFAEEHAFRPMAQMTDAEWAGVMNRLGDMIRGAG